MLSRLGMRFGTLLCCLLLVQCAEETGDDTLNVGSEPSPSAALEEVNEVSTPMEGIENDATAADTTPDSEMPCIPDCEDKLCGQDECGTLCGVCEEGFACTPEFTCEEYCEPQVNNVCNGSDVYWVDGCGNQQELKETCSTGTYCSDGACFPCSPNPDLTCEAGERVQLDSCDNIIDNLGTCEEGLICSSGQCVPAEDPLTGFFELTIEPVEMAYSEIEGYSTSIPGGLVSVLIDGNGAVEISWVNEEMPTLVGALFDKLNANGKLVEELDNGDVVERSFMLEALFVNEQKLQGEFKEWIFLNDVDAPLETSSRNVTGVRTALPY